MLSFSDCGIIVTVNDQIDAVLKKLTVFIRKGVSFWKGFDFHVA